MKQTFLCLAVLALSLLCTAQKQTRPEILILGTYHMANPGRDIHNMQADDVLSPKRQQEMEQLIEVLKRFRPTKVAIEDDVDSERVARQYSDYLAGKYTLTRNETNQVGYRLARELGHKAVYPVDEEGEFPFQRVINYAKANGTIDKFNALEAETDTMVKEEGEFLSSHTVLQMFEYLNSDAAAAQGVAHYYAYIPYGEPGEDAGPDLVAAWFQRNIRIYHNIRMLAASPDDRILVIYGAGHLGWLQQDVSNDASVQLRKLSDLTGKK